MPTNYKKALFILLATMLGGCVKLNDERTVEVGVGTMKSIILEAVKKDQKIKVEISSPGAAVNVYVFLEIDKDAVEEAIQAQKASDKILASQEKTESATLEASIPAKNATVILFTCAEGKTANVKVKSTN